MRAPITAKGYYVHETYDAEEGAPFGGVAWYVYSRGNHRLVCRCWSKASAQRICRLLNSEAWEPEEVPDV